LATPQEAEKPYPIDALPPIIRNAVVEYQAYGQQPLPLVVTSALSCASLATQGLADVARDDYLIGPISLYFLVVAVSGERKTSADNTFKAVIRHWMISRRDEMQPQVDAARAAVAAWEAERDGLLSRIKSAGGKLASNDIDVEALRDALSQLEQKKPTDVIVPRLFYEDTNAPTLAADLANDWPSASLWSDEAGLIVGAHGMSDDMAMGFIGLLNRLWDGNPFDRDRNTARRARIRGRRFTVSLMTQPIVMARLLTLAGGASRGMGLIARFLVTWPSSTIGSRPYRPIKGMPAVEWLAQRLRALLDMPLPLDPEDPTTMALASPVLPMTEKAQRIWRRFHDDVEAELGKTGEYSDVADIGAKAAENVARLAGVFHVIKCGPQGEIDSKTMLRASRVIGWHLHEGQRVLTAFNKPQSVADAETLLDWLLKQPAGPFDPRQILRRGPRCLRDKGRRDGAIGTLVDHQYLFPLAGTARRYVLNPRARAAS